MSDIRWNIYNIRANLFLREIPSARQSSFIKDKRAYDIANALKGFYIEKKLVWWIRIWSNSDSFDTDWMKIINSFIDEWFIKLSYFFISDLYKWNWYWIWFLKEITLTHKKCYLTCRWDRLLQYYKDLWFRKVYALGERYILVIDSI